MTPTETRERPILFSGPMIRAILDGTKTMTRQVIKPQPEQIDGPVIEWCHPRSGCIAAETTTELCWHCPYGQPGDRLWCRETFRVDYEHGENTRGAIPPMVIYRATDEEDPDDRWRPSIFMPRWASRISLEIVSVRVERVQDISEEDAEAEGMAQWAKASCSRLPEDELHARSYFELAWNSINGPRSYGWDSNPWVWVIAFKQVPIGDAPPPPPPPQRPAT